MTDHVIVACPYKCLDCEERHLEAECPNKTTEELVGELSNALDSSTSSDSSSIDDDRTMNNSLQNAEMTLNESVTVTADKIVALTTGIEAEREAITNRDVIVQQKSEKKKKTKRIIMRG